MTIVRPFILLKSIPSERYAAYKDRHIPIHARNIEELKKRHKVEKRMIEKEELQKRTEQFIKEKKLEAAINNHFKLLNII
jgi:hypothetical protein